MQHKALDPLGLTIHLGLELGGGTKLDGEMRAREHKHTWSDRR